MPNLEVLTAALRFYCMGVSFMLLAVLAFVVLVKFMEFIYDLTVKDDEPKKKDGWMC